MTNRISAAPVKQMEGALISTVVKTTTTRDLKLPTRHHTAEPGRDSLNWLSWAHSSQLQYTTRQDSYSLRDIFGAPGIYAVNSQDPGYMELSSSYDGNWGVSKCISEN